jgi:SPP1 family predicted phage head-tail adaptor
LRHRVELQERVTAVSPSGAVSYTWDHVATVWAQISPQRGDKVAAAAQIEAQQPVPVRIRYRSDVTTDTRLIYRGVVLEVVSVIDWEMRGVYLDLICTRRNADGFRAAKV